MSPPLWASFLHSAAATFFFILVALKTSYCEEHELFKNCSHAYSCGTIQNIQYPFWGDDIPMDCGLSGFELKCQNESYPVIKMESLEFHLLDINQTSMTMTIARMDYWNNTCVDEFINTTLAFPLFNYTVADRNMSIFYGCSESNTSILNNFTCPIDGGVDRSLAFYGDESFQVALEACNTSVKVPVLETALEELNNGETTLLEALRQGFEVVYPNINSGGCAGCKSSGGICGSNATSLTFMCLCRDHPRQFSCPVGGNLAFGIKLFIGIGAGILGLLFISIICCRRRIVSSKKLILSWKRNRTNDKSVEVFIRQHGSLAPKRYSYSDIKKITNSLKDKIGQGGYGGVYKGELLDGRLVAVKVLKESKGNGEEFINEVASISRTSHVNVVTLLGFCFEGHRRALTYEFMPNGSLEKFIYGGNTSITNDRNLGWEKLYQIAIGIARGLEYLHLGCNTRILHFDIKPHNILLDEDFCPKIADFGLAKLCLGKESVISMLGARGTIGYIAPEVYNRNFGGVSHKSDVYSYGSMILEMVGGRKNINVGVSQTSEIYFPHWIYKRLELENDFILEGVMTEGENEIARKMVLVGLWCIQTDPSQRPSISKVMDMLEGSIDALQIPPKPFLSSPPRSPEKLKNGQVTNVVKPEEANIPADDVMLLKNGPLQLSPDSDTVKWISSTSTTPNANGYDLLH